MAKPPKLEKKVVETLWASGELTAREVLEKVGSGQAYMTIKTVLDRLFEKGRVLRRKKGQAWVFRMAQPREVEVGAEISRLLTTQGVDQEPLLAAFVESAESLDPELLDRLDELIRQRREKKQ